MVYGLYNLLDKARRYAPYSNNEWKYFFIAWPLLALILGFDDGSESFELSRWLANFLLGAVAIALVIFIHEIVQRVTGLEQGFKITSKPFMYGLLAGIILSIMTNGRVMFMAHKSFHMDTLEAHRLGYFRYHRSYFAQGKIAFLGSVCVILAAVFLNYVSILPREFTEVFIEAAVVYSISNMLPIPPLDGALLMYASRLIYFFTFGAILGMAVVLKFGENIWILIASMIIMGLLIHLFYFRFLENQIGGSYD